MERPENPELDAIEASVEEILDLERKIAFLREGIDEQTRNISNIPDGATRLQIAAYAYWYIPETKVADLTWALLKNTKLQNRFLKLVGPRAGPIECDRCKGVLPVSSRTQMTEILGRLRTGKVRYAEGYRAICTPCEVALFEERHQHSRVAADVSNAAERTLRRMPYDEYLATDDWRKRKLRHMEHLQFVFGQGSTPQCEVCYAERDPDIFHKVTADYEETEGEWGNLDQLIMLCNNCSGALAAKGKILRRA